MNVGKLKGKIVEKGMRVDELAAMIGIDRSTMYRKLATKAPFSVGEARAIKDALELTNEEASSIFFD